MIRIVPDTGGGHALYIGCSLGFVEVVRDGDGDVIVTLKFYGRPARSWLLWKRSKP